MSEEHAEVGNHGDRAGNGRNRGHHKRVTITDMGKFRLVTLNCHELSRRYREGRPYTGDRLTVEQRDVAELQENCLALVGPEENGVVGFKCNLS